MDFVNWTYWHCFPLAIFVCILATSSGFSGGVLFQPVFYFILKIPIAQSIATGIATETIGMTWGALNYVLLNDAKTKIDRRAIKSIAPFVIVGVFAGIFFLPFVFLLVLRVLRLFLLPNAETGPELL